MIAEKVMDTRFHCLSPHQTIAEAVKMFRTAGREENKKIFGMMVTDGKDRLVGMLSMYDILRFIQAKHFQIFGEMTDLSVEDLFADLLRQVEKIHVEDIMTMNLITIKPDTHLMMVVDIMLKRHVRRLPVVERNRVSGIVYRSAVFDCLLRQLG